MDFDSIKSHFVIKQDNNERCKAICPCHQDRQASLCISYDEKEGKTLLKCQARCETKDILDRVGLKFSDLFDRKLENTNFKSKNPDIESVYKYQDKSGKIVFEKVRFKGKKFSQRRYVNGSIVWGLEEGEYFETYKGSNEFSMKKRNTSKRYFPLQEPSLYNLPKVIEAIENDRWVFIVEGEKDCDTLKSMGFVATTGSNGAGKGKWLEKHSQYFKGATVIILPDNDGVGKEYSDEIKKSIKRYAYKVKIVMTSDKEKGDISDWVSEDHTKEELIELVKNVEDEYSLWYEKNEKTGTIKLNKGLLAQNIKNTMEYIVTSTHGSRGLIHIYKNGVYLLASHNWVCAEITKYIKTRFRDANSIKNIAEQLSYKEPIQYDHINGDEKIINLRNGLYNIEAKELKPHSKDYISCFQLNCNYEIKYKNHGYWDKFINDLSNGNEEIKNVLQEYAGLTLSNMTGNRVKKVLLLYGKGDSGKSKFIEILCKMAGDENCINLKMQQLSDRFSMASIYGKRIVFNGDLPNSTLEDPSTLKEITGGDQLSAEFKGKDRFSFSFKGVLMFACNNLPYIKGDTGQHLFDRFLIVPCNNVIPVEQRDPLLIDKLMKDKNYIFQWALRGLERLIKQNYKFSYAEALEKQKENYMLASDSVRAFVKEGYDITGQSTDRIKSTELYKAYETYCLENENRTCCSEEFAKRLENNHGVVKYKYSGRKYFKGIKAKEFVLDSEEPVNWEEL